MLRDKAWVLEEGKQWGKGRETGRGTGKGGLSVREKRRTRSENDMSTNESRSFGDALEEPNHHEVCRILRRRSDHR